MIGCPGCGAGLHFDIASQQMACDHCGGHFAVESLADNSMRDDARASSFDCFVYTCPSCGAELVTTDKTDAIGFCQYCGGASMIFEKMRQEWKPERVIPFRVTKEDCKKAYKADVRHYPFVSGKYRDPELIESFRGVYMPYWSYRAAMQGEFRMHAKAPRERVSSRVYEIPYVDIIGSTNCTFDGYSHDASVTFDDDLSESIAPFDDKGGKPFAPGYLSGFYAETGNVDPHEYDTAINEEMTQDAVNMLSDDKNIRDYAKKYSFSLMPEKSSAPVRINSVSRALNPVWFMSHRSGKDITYAVVNGQTGKVAADLPLSPLRILIAAFAIAGLIFAGLLAVMHFIPSIKASTTLGLCLILLNAGMFYMQNSFNRTVDKNGARQGFIGPALFTLALIVSLVCGVIMASDGSYQHDLGDLATLPLLASCFVMLMANVSQAKDTGAVKKKKISNGSLLRVRISQEANLFLKKVIWLKAVIIVTILSGAYVVYLEPANSLIPYGLCLLAAAELFALAVFHIRFQTQVAKRPLPQFNKKGARYDEN